VSAPALTVPYLAAAALLAAAGAAKVARPSDTARALRGAGFPVDRRVVRAGAAGEVAVAVVAVAWSGRLGPSLVAAAYALFAVFVVTALRRGWSLSSCGCFGKPDARPSYLHAVLDTGAALCALVWAVTDPGSLGHVISSDPGNALWLLVSGGVVAGLAYAVWTRPLEPGVT
jgi:hypothetical protein